MLIKTNLLLQYRRWAGPPPPQPPPRREQPQEEEGARRGSVNPGVEGGVGGGFGPVPRPFRRARSRFGPGPHRRWHATRRAGQGRPGRLLSLVDGLGRGARPEEKVPCLWAVEMRPKGDTLLRPVGPWRSASNLFCTYYVCMCWVCLCVCLGVCLGVRAWVGNVHTDTDATYAGSVSRR